jgi:hypothetical protein
MALFHNSKSPVSGMSVAPASGINIGPGWTLSYTGMVYSPRAGTRRIVKDDGTLNDFVWSGTAWVAAPGIYDTLVQEAGGTWKLTRKDQSFRRFTSAGRLFEIGDASGKPRHLVLHEHLRRRPPDQRDRRFGPFAHVPVQ